MRLLNFYTPGYHNLRDLALVFSLDSEKEPDKDLTIRFFVGPNGSGKSTLMRFLVSIFALMDEGFEYKRPGNPAHDALFHLRYQANGRTITISKRDYDLRSITVQVEDHGERGEEKAKPRYYEKGELPSPGEILPLDIVVFSSGALQPWRDLFNIRIPPQKQVFSSLEKQPENEFRLPNDRKNRQKILDKLAEQERETEPTIESYNTGPSRIILVEPNHLPLALLASLIDLQRPQTRQEKLSKSLSFRTVLQHIGIENWIGFSIFVDLNPDGAKISNTGLLESGKWASQVVSQDDYQVLWVFDLDNHHSCPRIPLRFIKALFPDLRIKDIQPIAVFRKLVELMQAGILVQVQIILNKKIVGSSPHLTRTLLLEMLSDGEQAFLERMALIHLFRDSERLLIFDEPEIHFNDSWKRDLVDHIEQTLLATNSEVIISTHSSITLTDAYPSEVIRLGLDGQLNVPMTLGTEPGVILQTIHDPEQQSVGKRALRRIDEALNRGKVEELNQMLSQVGSGYQRMRIVEAIIRNAPSNKKT